MEVPIFDDDNLKLNYNDSNYKNLISVLNLFI